MGSVGTIVSQEKMQIICIGAHFPLTL